MNYDYYMNYYTQSRKFYANNIQLTNDSIYVSKNAKPKTVVNNTNNIRISNTTKTSIDNEKYIIRGTCNETNDFNITINNIVIYDNNEIIYFEVGEKYTAVVSNGKFTCELDILPTAMDYAFVQNIDEFSNDPVNTNAVMPNITDFTHFCSTEYCDTKTNILYGLDEKLSKYIK